MKRSIVLAALLLTGATAWSAETSSFEAEKAKALQQPYANDFGPEKVDVTGYPADIQKAYNEVLLQKCTRCHSSARPLNSQFVEPSGPKDGHQAKIAAWKTSNPEMFADKLVWQVEGKSASGPGIWERYVKKMMAKPGCSISPAEGKQVWSFLAYDSEKRKTGANATKWAEQRKKLLADFKAKYPARYSELYEVR